MAPLTPGDFDRLERLATAFRPSWELDDAPFTGAGSLSPGDIRALQGGGTHVDVRAAVATSFGSPSSAQASHAPAKPAVTVEEPANKVIVDPALVAPAASVRPPPERPQVVASAGPWAASTAMPPLAPAHGRPSNRPPAPSAGPVPSTQRITARPPRPAFPTEPSFSTGAKKSKTGLVVGAAGAAALVIGGVMWLASGSSEKPVAAPAPAETATAAQHSIPPPPPETLAANAASPSQASHPVQAAQAQPSMPAPPVIAATALPPAPHVVMAAPAPRPVASPPPAPKPATASRPKGPTIVRDVPF